MSDKSPFIIFAATNIEKGYNYKLCFECRIRDNVFTYNKLAISGESNETEERKVKYCKASIKSISSLGLMKIEFSEMMNTNFTLDRFMNETYIDIFVTPVSDDAEQFPRNINLTWENQTFVNNVLEI